jgi:DNA-binding winged helix-turn-helix (wHTH) protein
VDRTLIRTVSGRGYQFTGEIRNLSEGPNNAGAEVEKAEHTLLRALVRDAVEFAVSDSRPEPRHPVGGLVGHRARMVARV